MSSSVAVAAYRASQTGGAITLVEEHFQLVKSIANHLVRRMPSSVEVDDLIQAGMLGLLEASRSFQNDKGASFTTFASLRIRGAMIDEVRKGDWVPRSVYQQYRAIVAATRAAEAKLLREPTATEIAAEAGMSEADFHRVLDDASRGQLLSLEMRQDENDGECAIPGRASGTPSAVLQSESFRHELASAIESLPERERLVLSLYYEQELNQKEIGAVLQVTESRVSQLLGQATLRLRAKLRDWEMADLVDEDQN